MEAILYYLLKVSIGTAVFYTTYFFLFRKSKGFVFNRCYLAGSFIAAFIIPLLTFPTYSPFSPVTIFFSGNRVSRAWTSELKAKTMESDIGLADVLLYGYLIGLVICLARLIVGYIAAARIGKNCKEVNIAGMKVWVAEQKDMAFTFLDKIIIGKNLLGNASLEMVLHHEAVHSRERHFYDIILSELLLALQWFNPFARFHAQAIRNNLEFRADDRVISVSDKQEYQYTMLAMALNSINSPLFTAINSSNLQKRMIMMNAKNKNRFVSLSRLAILPVFALLLLSLSGKKTVAISDSGSGIEQSSQQVQEDPSDSINSIEGINKYLSKNLKYPNDARSAGLIGTVRLYARVSADGIIQQVLEVKPDEEYIEYDEVVIIGYMGERSENLEKINSYRHKTLLTEGKRVIESLPKLEITDFQGKLVQFNFRFDLRSTYDRSKIWEPDIDLETIDLISK
ncbi:M56 family metallopeptidase [Cyclobacterium salsum]|uniref:M56 family metallopeptidase n=1 Tax=Cyclobacterium salsum TaxID=2666329 RepID=UPI0013919819|nr:M56 family metallopeptidase [Cyclobacterium salsum]